jgi:hypothetical protein
VTCTKRPRDAGLAGRMDNEKIALDQIRMVP